MRYRCEILNHGIDGYEVWLHGRNQGRSGVKLPYISEDEISRTINSLKNASAGWDNIPTFVVKKVTKHIIRPLTYF